MKKQQGLLILVFLTQLYMPCIAQISFGSQQVITERSDDAMCALPEDIDGDGDLDVISVSYDDNKISWYENIDGQANFGLPKTITTEAIGVYTVCSADIDGDGDKDVISALYDDDKVAWYENMDGQGTFGSQQVITTETDGAYTVCSADIDGDGDMDVLSASNGDSKIAWYENVDGQGSFGDQNLIGDLLNNVRVIHAADFDGDGDIDVVAAPYNGICEIYWYENTDGLGAFVQQARITANICSTVSLFSSDIDGDGDLDLLSASAYDDKIAWYENTIWGFSVEQVITSSAEGARSVYAADFDGDGDVDVLAASQNDDKVVWYENTDGQGTFVEKQVINDRANAVRHVTVGDLDGDGDMDVLSASWQDDKIAWYENTDGAGTFSHQKILSLGALGANSVYAADIDNDGDKDVLSSSSSDDKIVWYENVDGAGAFELPVEITTNALGAKSVYAVDLDGDEDVDVLSASALDNKIAWYENVDGDGVFSVEQVISNSAQGAMYVTSGDLDGDGDMDVVSGSLYDGKIAWYENTDSQGSFGNELIVDDNASQVSSVHVSDLDGDGDMDILSALYFMNRVVWYENIDGQGSFGPQRVITTNVSGALSAYSADLDGDGDEDVLSASSSDNKIAWYENINGTGSFSDEYVITTNAEAASFVFASDLDGDNKVDVLSASSLDSKIAWYKNLGVFNNTESLTALDKDLRIFPNPSFDFVKIISDESRIEHIEILDLRGEILKSYREQSLCTIISLEELEAGTYIIKIMTASGVYTSELVKL